MSRSPERPTPTPPAACASCTDGICALEPPAAVWRLALALVFAGQGMMIGLGYNNALAQGEAPAYGSPAYWLLQAVLAALALAAMALLLPALVRTAWRAARARTVVVDHLFLLTLGGAFLASTQASLTGRGAVFYEVVPIVLSIQALGRTLGQRQRAKVMAEVAKLEAAHDYAWLLGEDGRRRRMGVGSVPLGAHIVVRPGETIPLDGKVISGATGVVETALTGEPAPRQVQPEDAVWAGTHALDGELVLQVEAGPGHRRLDRLTQAVRQATLRPSRLEAEADRVMRLFLPVVAGLALATALVWAAQGAPWEVITYNALSVLLVACPCALGLAMPIALWGGLRALGSLGLSTRSGALLDRLAAARWVVFDKTGTLSEAQLTVLTFTPEPAWIAQAETLRGAIAALESSFDHPVARTLASWTTPQGQVTEARLIPGLGVQGMVDGCAYRIQSAAAGPVPAPAGTWHVYVSGSLAATLRLGERLRPQAESTIESLRACGIGVRIFSGDPNPIWTHIAGVAVESGLSAEAKVARLQALDATGQESLFVGDGINDAAAMAHAAAAVVLDHGADLTRATADGVLAGGRLATLPEAVRLARRIRQGIRANLWFAAAYNAIGMGLAATGQLHPVVAAVLMLVSSALVSWRALRSVRAGGGAFSG